MVDVNTWIAWSKDLEVLNRSASGGIAYELAKKVIEDGGVVFGVSDKRPFGETYPHTTDCELHWMMIDNIKSLFLLQGSKYWQPAQPSNWMHVEMSKALEKNKVLFIGTPCQVKVVQNYFDNNDNLITVTLECHGFYKKEGLKRNGDHKKHGWSKSWWHLPKDYLNYKGIKQGCKNCKIERCNGDITLSDAWGCPKHQINERGTSRVKLNNKKGATLFHRLENVYKTIEGIIQFKPRRVAILDVHDHNNFGNNLLCINLMNVMRKENPEVQFVLFDRPEGGIEEKVIQQTSLKYGEDFFVRSCNIMDGFSFRFLKQGIQTEAFKDCDDIIILGGDCFATTRWLWRWTVWVALFWKLTNMFGLEHDSCKKHLYFLSNTIGDIPFYIKPIFKRVLNKFAGIFVRDVWSSKELEKLGVKDNVHIGVDIGVIPFPDEPEHYEKKNYIVFSPSGLWHKYSDTYNDYIISLQWIVNNLKNRFPEKNIILMPHGTSIEEQKVVTNLRNITGLLSVYPENAKEARKILAESSFNVCMRMHSAVQSFAVGTPFVVFGCTPKYQAVLGSMFNQYYRIIDGINFIELDEKLRDKEVLKPIDSFGITICQAKAYADILIMMKKQKLLKSSETPL